MPVSAVSTTVSDTSVCPTCQRPDVPLTPPWDATASAALDLIIALQDTLYDLQRVLEEGAGL